MFKKFSPILLVIFLPFFQSCEDSEITEILKPSLSEEEIGNGLKEALKVGTDTSVSNLSATDGYYKNDT